MPLVLILLLFVSLILFIVKPYISSWLSSKRLAADERDIHDLLEINLPYYKPLTPQNKRIFIKRVVNFRAEKEFVGKEGFDLTEEIELLISAVAVQLTWGFDNYFLFHYNTINVYPEAFYVPSLRQFHKGNTLSNGIINLSWEDFRKGFANYTDKINLGFHELAHALEFDFIYGEGSSQNFSDYYQSWKDFLDEEMENIQTDKYEFLRKYGKTDRHELFAVCVETFFESPHDFRKNAPEMFTHLCVLLNQDPTNRLKNDYELEKNSPEFDGFEKDYTKRSSHWSISVFTLGVFGFMALLIVIPGSFIPIKQSLINYFGFLMIGLVWQYRYFKENYWMGISYYIAYNVFGFAVVCLALSIGINRLVPVSTPELAFSQVTGKDLIEDSSTPKWSMTFYYDLGENRENISELFNLQENSKYKHIDYQVPNLILTDNNNKTHILTIQAFEGNQIIFTNGSKVYYKDHYKYPLIEIERKTRSAPYGWTPKKSALVIVQKGIFGYPFLKQKMIVFLPKD